MVLSLANKDFSLKISFSPKILLLVGTENRLLCPILVTEKCLPCPILVTQNRLYCPLRGVTFFECQGFRLIHEVNKFEIIFFSELQRFCRDMWSAHLDWNSFTTVYTCHCTLVVQLASCLYRTTDQYLAPGWPQYRFH